MNLSPKKSTQFRNEADFLLKVESLKTFTHGHAPVIENLVKLQRRPSPWRVGHWPAPNTLMIGGFPRQLFSLLMISFKIAVTLTKFCQRVNIHNHWRWIVYYCANFGTNRRFEPDLRRTHSSALVVCRRCETKVDDRNYGKPSVQ